MGLIDLCGNLGGAYSAGGTMQTATYESIGRLQSQIDDIKQEKSEYVSALNDIIHDTSPKERTKLDNELIDTYKGYIKEYNEQISDIEKEIKAIKKAGREENKGQLTFFSMRKTK